MREVHTITGVEVASGQRGPYHKIKVDGSKASIFCFDAAAGNLAQQHVGQTVALDVDRSPGKDGKVFPKVTAFLGAADPGSVEAAPPVVAAGSGAAGGSRGGGAVFGTSSTDGRLMTPAKKDPLGLVTSLRQTSLNAAVAYCGSLRESDGEKVLDTARRFYAYLSEGLPLEVPNA